MKKIALILLFGLSLNIQCSSLQKTAHKHIVRGDSYSQKQSAYRALREYDSGMNGADIIIHDATGRFLIATLYYHLYLIDAVTLYQNADPLFQERCIYLTGALKETPEIDFLAKSFREIVLTENSPRQYKIDQIEPYLLIDRSLIIGDYLARQAQNNQLLAQTDNIIPRDLMNQISRYIYLEIARSFYLDAWSRATIVSYDNPPDNISYLLGLSVQRLKTTYISLISTYDVLTIYHSPDRLKHYKDVLAKVEMFRLENLTPAQVSQLTPEKICTSELDEQLNRSEIMADTPFHIQEMRQQMSRAIEEMVGADKQVVGEYLFRALAALIRAKEFSYQQPAEITDFLDKTMVDIYRNLNRLAAPQSD